MTLKEAIHAGYDHPVVALPNGKRGRVYSWSVYNDDEYFECLVDVEGTRQMHHLHAETPAEVK